VLPRHFCFAPKNGHQPGSPLVCFKVSLFHTATTLVFVVSIDEGDLLTRNHRIVWIGKTRSPSYRDRSGYQSAIRMRVAWKVAPGA
jgi:hypothetical protein